MIKFLMPLWILFLLMMASAAYAGDIVDRIVATVNGHIILQSDWEDALHYEAFIAEHSPEKLTFVTIGVAQVQAMPVTVGARILLLPGAFVLWPLVLSRWLRTCGDR